MPTIQRLEASDGVIRDKVDCQMKQVGALAFAGIELMGDGSVSPCGGRGLRPAAALLTSVRASW